MSDPSVPDPEIQAQIAEGFMSGAERYADLILDPDHPSWLSPSTRRQISEYSLGDGVLAEAAGLLAEQTLQGLASELGEFVNRLPGRASSDDHAQALMLALLLVGRRVAGAAQIRHEELAFGDHPRGLEQLVIEPDTLVGDFEVDFLLTYSQLGPNPARRDSSEPSGVTVTRRLALVRDRRYRDSHHDDIIRRRALGGPLNMIAVSYEESDIVRDPFALASRVVRDLAQATTDELYG